MEPGEGDGSDIGTSWWCAGQPGHDTAEQQSLTDGADPRRASEEKRRRHLCVDRELADVGSERTIDLFEDRRSQRIQCLVRYGGGADANDIWRAVPSRQYRRLGECQWGKRSGAIRSRHVSGLEVRSAQTSGNRGGEWDAWVSRVKSVAGHVANDVCFLPSPDNVRKQYQSFAIASHPKPLTKCVRDEP